MDITNVLVIFLIISVAGVLGAVFGWLLRQQRIDRLEKMLLDLETEKENEEEIKKQYEVDRELLRKEVEKYKDAYNAQLTKNQRLSENLRQNHVEIELLQEKIKNLTELSLQANQEVERLRKEVKSQTIPKVISEREEEPPRRFTGTLKKHLSLLDKTKK